MAQRVTVRKAKKGDVTAIVDLWKELMDFHKSLDAVFTRSRTGHKVFAEYLAKERLDNEIACTWVAHSGTMVVGFCMAVIKKSPPVVKIKEYGHLEVMVVPKEWQGKGIGRRLFKKAKSWFDKKNLIRLEVHFSVHNEMARAFWREMGFLPYLETGFMELE